MFLITISKIDKWGKERNISKLVESLKHEDEEIRKAAALSLGIVGDASVLDKMKEAYSEEENIFVKKDINSAIKQIKSKKFITGTPIFEDKHEKELRPVFNFNTRLGS